MLEFGTGLLDELLRAIETDDIDSVKDLLPRIEVIDQENDEGDTALLTAASLGNVEVVKLLIANGADVNYETDAYFYTALMRAAGGNHAEVVRTLIEAGANVDAADDWGETSLMRGAERGNQEAVRLLLEHGADRSLTNDRGKTAEELARDADHDEIAVLINPRQSPSLRLGWLSTLWRR